MMHGESLTFSKETYKQKDILFLFKDVCPPHLYCSSLRSPSIRHGLIIIISFRQY